MPAREISPKLKTKKISAALNLKIQELTREDRDRSYSNKDCVDLNSLIRIRDCLFGDMPYDSLLNIHKISNHVAADILLRNGIINETLYQIIKPTNAALPSRRP